MKRKKAQSNEYGAKDFKKKKQQKLKVIFFAATKLVVRNKLTKQCDH